MWGWSSSRAGARLAVSLVTVVGAAVALLAVADEAEAVHFWSGTLRTEPGPAPGTVLVDGYLSFDSSFIPWAAGTTITGTPLDAAICQDTPPDELVGLRLNSPANPANNGAWGVLLVDGVPIHFELLVVAAEGPADPDNPSDHCRFVGKIVTPGTEVPVIAVAPLGDSVDVVWQKCCRENHPSHVNNNGGGTINAAMVITADLDNGGPFIDFEMFAPAPYLSDLGYGNVHCKADSICNFQIYARDPENDALTYRLATPGEATNYQNAFYHPPQMTVGSSGLITWDTNGISPGDVYSTQVIVSDGFNTVAIDYMIEVGDPPEPCWDGSTPIINPVDGTAECPPIPPPDCPPGSYRKDPGNPYSECIFPPEEEYQPVYGEPKPKSPFWLPEPTYKQVKDPARSDVQHAHAHAHDRINEEIARLDQDGDGARDRDDRCLDDALTQEQDLDGDGIGDACDPDMDGDGVENALDPCSFDPGDVCVTPSAPPEAESLGTATLGDLLAGAAAPEDRGGAEKVPVASVAPSKSPAGSIMLAVLGGALLLLLLAIAMRRRD